MGHSKELNLGNQISKYYQSFSGTDTLAFIMMPGSVPVCIGSLTTISYSMYRNKKPVINIGRTNINGVTRGSRIFAGTMIFTLINQHWLKELQEQLDWISGFAELKVDELPLFDIMIVSANEYGNAISMYIYGIDFTDEAQTISVEDLFTENVFSFVARDISNFKKIKYGVTASEKNSNKLINEHTQRLYVLDTSSINLNDAIELERKMTLAKTKQLTRDTKRYTLARELYYSSSRLMMGNDVAEIQELLQRIKYPNISVTGIFDSEMDKVVKAYQSDIGEEPNGVVNDRLYNSLINKVSSNEIKYGVIVNKYGAYIYKHPDLLSDIVDVKSYKDQVYIHDIITESNNNSNTWYKVNTGYILMEDVYCSYYAGGIVEFPIIKYGNNNAYVTMVQTALSKIYPEFTEINGNYNYTTQEYIKKFQKNNGLEETGNVDNDTWLLLQGCSGNIASEISNDNFKIEMETPPGIYEISSENIIERIHTFNATISCDNYIPVKECVVCIYDDKTSEILTKTTSIKESQTISLQEFQNAFVYNPKYGKAPIQVDYIIYPYNKKPFKWSIMYS